MRFVIVTASSLKDLANTLNEMTLGTGRVVGYSKSGKVYEALVDMYPTHVVTNDDLFFDIDEDKPKGNKIAISA